MATSWGVRASLHGVLTIGFVGFALALGLPWLMGATDHYGLPHFLGLLALVVALAALIARLLADRLAAPIRLMTAKLSTTATDAAGPACTGVAELHALDTALQRYCADHAAARAQWQQDASTAGRRA